MKLSLDRCRNRTGFEWLASSIFSEYLYTCPSLARGLGRQTFSGSTRTWQNVVLFASRPKDGLESACGSRVEMPSEIQEAQFALVLPP